MIQTTNLRVVRTGEAMDEDVAVVAEVVVVAADVFKVEAGENITLPTRIKSGTRGTKIVVLPKVRSLATAAANLVSYDPNAQSATPERRIAQ